MSWVFECRASTILYNYLCSLKGDWEFALPANVCPIVPAVFLKARKPFVLLDISPRTLCLDRAQVEAFLETGDRRKGIFYVRTFGSLVEVGSWFDEIRSACPGLQIVDDRCLCRPCFDSGSTEPLADMTLYSTGYSKFVDLGWGGFAFCSEQVASTYRRQRLNYSVQAHEGLVAKFRDAIARRQSITRLDGPWLNTEPCVLTFEDYRDLVLGKLGAAERQKVALNEVYRVCIPRRLWLGDRFSDWRFSVLVANKESLLEKIFASGHFASSHYASMSGIFDSGYARESENVYSRIVNLFNDHRTTEQQAVEVARIVVEHSEGISGNSVGRF